MKLTNQLVLVGQLQTIQPPEETLISDAENEKEIREINFEVTDEANGLRLEATANREQGTAFYALLHDPLYQEGCTVRATGYLSNLYGHTLFIVQELQRSTSHANLEIDAASLTIDQLKDKAQGNLYMGKAALFKLLDNFPPESAQAYAIATQLRRQHRDRSNVGFDLVRPIPREPSEPPPSFDEIQVKLRQKFGNRR